LMPHCSSMATASASAVTRRASRCTTRKRSAWRRWRRLYRGRWQGRAVWELVHRIVDRRRPHALGRTRASFGRRRRPQRDKARIFGSGSEDDRDGPTPPP
jgi:hypothetical protein